MQHKVKLTVIDKKLYPELQAQYCKDPSAGACPCYNVGDVFIFERYGAADDFWHIGFNSLRQTAYTAESIAGGTSFPHCSEAWDAISRYIYTGLQGGAIMRNWMDDERIMIACCSDGTRPVIFKIEGIDYKVMYITGISCEKCKEKIRTALMQIENVKEVSFKEKWAEVTLEKEVEDAVLKSAAEAAGDYTVDKID